MRVGSADSGTVAVQATGGGAIPTSTLHVRCIPWSIGRQFIRQHHYMHNAPPTGRVAFGVFADDAPLSQLIGALLYGRPAARYEDQISTVELRRMLLLDVTARNAESRVIAYTLRYFRRHMPDVRRVIAYSDPSAGHEGVIYKASGFQFAGETAGSGGATKVETLRAGCNLITASPKRKYEQWLGEP